MSRAFDSFVRWESATRDTIDLKKTYIDMADDLIAGVMLSQIVYWHLPRQEDGRPKMKTRRGGHLWVVKKRGDWWDECRIKPRQADRALKILEDKGLVVCEVHRWGEKQSPIMHVRIDKDEFMRAFSAALKAAEARLREKAAEAERREQEKAASARNHGSGKTKSRIGDNANHGSGSSRSTETSDTESTGPPGGVPPHRADTYVAMIENQSRLLGVSLDADERRNLAGYCKRLIENHGAEPLAMLRWASHYATRRKEDPRLRPSQAWSDVAGGGAAVGNKRYAGEAPTGGEEGRRRRTEGYEWLFEDRKPAPKREPVLLSLVPDDQRDGLVAPEVQRILLRRLDELAEQGYEAFERGVEEICESPWVDHDTRMRLFGRKVEMKDADGEARSA